MYPVANDIYDGELPFTALYDRLIPKATKPELALAVTSADAAYNNIKVGSNEFDRALRYVAKQNVQAVVLDDDTGCAGEYTCQNAGVCVHSASGSKCVCKPNFGMHDCSVSCSIKRACSFRRVAFRLKCQPQSASAICGSEFSAATFASTLYRMLTSNEFTAASGQVFTKLSLAPLSRVLYVVNSSRVACVDGSSSSASPCVAVSMDVNTSSSNSSGATSESTAVLEKLEAFMSSGSLQAAPIFAELMTSEQQYRTDIGATVAVWIFIGFCALCVTTIASLFITRLVRAKRSHVTPQLDRDDVAPAPPATHTSNEPTPLATSPRST